MTPEQKEAARRAEIMLAFSRGEKIEQMVVNGGSWNRVCSPLWCWGDVEYRVARVPIELKVTFSIQNDTLMCESVDYNRDEIRRRIGDNGRLTLVFREVIE